MPTQNRLKLDWTLNTSTERRDFVDEYIQKIKNPTEEELETIANYILWGKDQDGLNATQRGEIQIETRNKTWQREDTDSLDEMMESPTFNEATLRRPTEIRTKTTREVFDRQKALQECPEHMRPLFEELFNRIDKLEMSIHFYEFAHNKRKEPPRAALLNRFDESEIAAAKARAEKWNQFKYLKQRHLIVELRREQFTLRDSFKTFVMNKSTPEPELELLGLDFDAEIPVFPLGLMGTSISRLLFKDAEDLNPFTYTEAELEKVIKFYWGKKAEKTSNGALCFDFCELEHVYELFGQLVEIEESIETFSVESNLGKLIATLQYYISMADLTEVQREILDLKIKKERNQQIADHINKKYGKSYTANYISTIFRQKIIPRINEVAIFHAQIVENLCYPENFKKCTGCGRTLLIDSQNFVRKTRSKDGFSARCKQCDRLDRQKRR